MSKSTNTNFTEFKHCYRVEVYEYGTGKRFVSNESFDNYEDAWEYAKNNTSNFCACGYCVVELDEPELQFNIDFNKCLANHQFPLYPSEDKECNNCAE